MFGGGNVLDPGFEYLWAHYVKICNMSFTSNDCSLIVVGDRDGNRNLKISKALLKD